MITCGGGAPWEGPLVRGLQRKELGVRVTRRCVDPGELLGVAQRDAPRVALVAAELPWLDRELVAGLGAAGVAVVAIATAPVVRPLDRLGVVSVLDASVPPEAVAAALHALGARIAAPRDRSEGNVGPPGSGGSPAGGLVVVWGGQGAPGRTTVAVHLAASLARHAPTLLIDGDAWAPSVAQRLGIPETPGLLRAGRLAVAGWPDTLPSCAHATKSGVAVLPGLPRAELWPEVRERAWIDVLDAARDAASAVVVDVAAPIEEDEELSFDRVPYRRNVLTRVALREASTIVLVVAADPIGIRRGVLGRRQLGEHMPEVIAPVSIVLNRVGGGARAQQCSSEIERFTGDLPSALLPDEPALMRAVWEGRALQEFAPRSRWLRELAPLARLVQK